MDLQTCHLKLESWNYLNHEVTFHWKKDGIVIKEKSDTMNQHDFAVEFMSDVGFQYTSFNGRISCECIYNILELNY